MERAHLVVVSKIVEKYSVPFVLGSINSHCFQMVADKLVNLIP